MPSLYELLIKTSRTFALAIPLLPEPTRTTTCLSYLLFRVADTLEDAASWSREARLDALAAWGELLEGAEPARVRAVSERWNAKNISQHEGYKELLLAVPQVLAELSLVDGETQRIVRDHARRTVRGMLATLRRGDAAGGVRMATLEDLRAYCYIVAGIVGELLTALFIHDCPRLAEVKDTLVGNDVAFGEALQLVNILKDEAEDTNEGRVYLPANVKRSEVVELARRDLACARRYIEALELGGAPPGFSAFTSLSAELAEATLVRLVEGGPGAKVPRADVLRLFDRYRLAASAPAAADHSAMAQRGK